MESKYIALSRDLRDITPIKGLIEQVWKALKLQSKTLIIKWTLFEDNNRALQLAKVSKIRSKIKFIAIKYHHFRICVKNSSIKIEAIGTSQQQADILTNLPISQFWCLRQLIMR